MNNKRIFGPLLTILGITGLIYGVVLLVNSSDGVRELKTLIIYGVLGLILGISLFGGRRIKDKG